MQGLAPRVSAPGDCLLMLASVVRLHVGFQQCLQRLPIWKKSLSSAFIRKSVLLELAVLGTDFFCIHGHTGLVVLQSTQKKVKTNSRQSSAATGQIWLRGLPELQCGGAFRRITGQRWFEARRNRGSRWEPGLRIGVVPHEGPCWEFLLSFPLISEVCRSMMASLGIS